MADSAAQIILPRPPEVEGRRFIAAPSESEFIEQFGPFYPAAQYVQSAYGATAYYDCTARNPPPGTATQRLIFIHGVGTPAMGLIALARKLQELNPNLHVVLYDLWGHGLSQTPLAPHVQALFHSQILNLLGHLKWQSAHLVGYSFGGVTAASFTAFHPDRVESVAIIAPAGLLRSADLPEDERLLLQGGPDVYEASRDWVLGFLEGGPLVLPQGWKKRALQGEFVAPAVRYWEKTLHKGHVASTVGLFRDGQVFDGHENFKIALKQGKKTLAMIGELDDICTVQDLERVGWKDVVVVKGAGHGLIRENVDEVAAQLQQFLDNHA